MRIFILGATGMLGKYCHKYLEEYFQIIPLGRDKFDALQMLNKESLSFFFDQGYELSSDDIFINCIGTIKPRIDALGATNAVAINALFPRILSDFLFERKISLIHPTTDCVYSGLKGNYSEDDQYDVSDIYGMSKALGEPLNCTVIRTSIIGEEDGQSRSLVEWIKSSKSTKVPGYTNHYWSGVTCLQFAKICKKLIDEGRLWSGTRHIHSEKISKFQLIELVNQAYELNISVEPCEAPQACDRSLLTKFKELNEIEIPSLKQQIQEMKDFSGVLLEKNTSD